MSEERPKKELSAEGVSMMQSLEREMGVILLAWYQQPAEYAKLNEAQVKKLQELEEALKATVIAYKP
jgi:hypothetical protein